MQVNQLFFVGSNKYGQAGTGEKDSSRVFQIPRNYDFGVFIKQVSCGYHHSAILTINGDVYVMGSNIHGTLASKQEGLNYSFLPILVEGLPTIDKVESGAFHLCVLSNEGKAYSWGRGMDGQLGTGVNKNSSTPELITVEEEIIDLSCGTNHTILLSSSNIAYAFGNGIYGQLGTGNNKNQSKPKRISLQNVSMVAAGDNHSLYLCDGTVFATGDNTSGQIGIGNSKKYVLEPQMLQLHNVSIIQASKFSAAIADQQLYVWGYKSGHFKPHQVESGEKFSEMKCGNQTVIVLSAKGGLYNWNISEREAGLVESSVKCSAVLGFSVGENHSIVLGDIVRTVKEEAMVPLMLRHYSSSEVMETSQPSNKIPRQNVNLSQSKIEKNKENTRIYSNQPAHSTPPKNIPDQINKNSLFSSLQTCRRTFQEVKQLLQRTSKIGRDPTKLQPTSLRRDNKNAFKEKETTMLLREKDLVISDLQDEISRKQVLIVSYEETLSSLEKLLQIQASQLQLLSPSDF